MEEVKKLKIRISEEFLIDIDDVYQYGIETFGIKQADKYEIEIWRIIENLTHNYLFFPECRYLHTKNKIYRWIILDAHVIIYRITNSEIQILRILHNRRSIATIKSSTKIKL